MSGEIKHKEIKLEEITSEEISRLLERARETEWKYLLRVREWVRQGPAYTDYAEFKIVYGEAEEIKVREWDSGYPYERGWEYIIIPKTVPVVVLWEHVTDERQDTRIYVFTKDGWKEVEV
jgi:hypothetical protein